ncbi:MAG: ATP-grasp domain-containing protein [Desulfobacteraceae bacterium]|nr:ATP-grasp domain-containing protein [Desulfobacteraceae bacterium]
MIQEYMEGPSYSIEVIGCPEDYKTLQVTDLAMDKTYDCKRVTAPTQLLPHQISKFEKIALALAKAIRLKGIMDVEVVLNKDKLKLLEIDARLPSQTPITVYWSTGINMVEMLGDLFLNKKNPDTGQKPNIGQKPEQFVVVEHIRVSESDLTVMGEHIMSQDGPLTLESNFFGAKEAITSFSPGKKRWVATLIFTGSTHGDIMAKKQNCYEKIIESGGIIPGEP